MPHLLLGPVEVLEDVASTERVDRSIGAFAVVQQSSPTAVQLLAFQIHDRRVEVGRVNDAERVLEVVQ